MWYIGHAPETETERIVEAKLRELYGPPESYVKVGLYDGPAKQRK